MKLLHSLKQTILFRLLLAAIDEADGVQLATHLRQMVREKQGEKAEQQFRQRALEFASELEKGLNV